MTTQRPPLPRGGEADAGELRVGHKGYLGVAHPVSLVVAYEKFPLTVISVPAVTTAISHGGVVRPGTSLQHTS